MNQSKIAPECECTKSCRSLQHGSLLTAALTKRAVSDAQLASFCRNTCQNFLRILDHQGRSLIHMAASRGRYSFLEWLLNHFPSNQQGMDIVDMRDPESGYTALHRSIFYGQLHTAIALTKRGASISTVDNEDMNAIDLALLDRHKRFGLSKNQLCEVYIWGANTNYTLGTSSQQQRNFPELLNSFTKQDVFIKQVCLGKFHGIFVSSGGGVWSCGLGEGGRLGVATRDTCVTPTPLSLSEPCAQAAIGRDHTILLMQSGAILSCGLNDYHQLGQVPPPPFKLSPKPVKLRLSAIRGVYAARYHSVAFNARTVYTWGLNGGQLGHSREDGKMITTPKKVLCVGSNNDEYSIDCVATSDGATVVTTSKGDIYLINQFQCKKIAFRLHNIKCVRVTGGEAEGGDKLTDQQRLLSVLMLDTIGNIYLWQDTSSQFMRCIFNTSRPLVITEVILTRELISMITKNGEAFQGNIMPKKVTSVKPRSEIPDDYSPQSKDRGSSKKTLNQTIDKNECYMVKLKRIPNVHRAVDVSCDSKANNFAVLQVVPNASLIDLPQVMSSQMKEDFLTLLDEASEMDILHDVLIKVGKVTYPAHKYILAYGSEYFSKLFSENADEKTDSVNVLKINIDNVHPIIFKQILIYLYTGTCDLLVPSPCNIKIENDNKENGTTNDDNSNYDNISAFEVYNKKGKTDKGVKQKDKSKKFDKVNSMYCDPVRLLQAAAKKLGVNSLYKILDKFGWDGENIVIRYADRKYDEVKFGFDQNCLTDFYDAHIKCSDGQIIKAHKCILAARLEYFNGMFCHTWIESSRCSTVSLHIGKKFMMPIIKFLYTDECPELNDCEDSEFLGQMLVICDQFFVTRMREMCEAALSNMLTLKNSPEILQIADLYNCPQLKNCCMEYISLNFSSFLESKSLESVSHKLLNEISEYYCDFNPAVMGSRVITPFSDAPEDCVVISSAETSPVDFDQNIDDDTLKNIEKEFSAQTGKKKGRLRKSSHSESEKIDKVVHRRDVHKNNATKQPAVKNEPKNSNQNKSEEVPDQWQEVTNTQKQKIVLARLKTVTKAKENVNLLNTEGTFTKLTKRDQTTTPVRSPTEHFAKMDESHRSSSFENDSSTDDSSSRLCRSPIALNITVNTKLSQKQRKRLMSGNKDISPCKEFSDPSLENKNGEAVSPKNPWKKVEVQDASSPKEDLNFNAILEDQRKQKENLTKIMTKSLLLTQMEDRAIYELTKYYNSIAEKGEKITVERVSRGRIADPQWLHRSNKNA